MGRIGADSITAELKARGSSSGKVRMLTHCNTGSLATAAYGTALGVVRSLHESGHLAHAYCTETRPYNQGAVALPTPSPVLPLRPDTTMMNPRLLWPGIQAIPGEFPGPGTVTWHILRWIALQCQACKPVRRVVGVQGPG